MSKVAIVTDSTACIPDEILSQYDIRVAPQVLIWGAETYLDGVDIQPDEFYRRLEKARVMPTTSQASPKTFHDIFQQLMAEDFEILAVLVAGQLSGTIASAVQAKEMLPGAPVEIVDSKSAAMAMGFQVLEAAKAAKEGASLADCRAIAERAREHTGVIFAVDTLEFLHRGGRIGGATRLLGTALNIKPILELAEGRVEPVDRVRTRKKSLMRVVELIEERVGDRRPIHLSTLHANAREDAEELLRIASGRLDIVENIYSPVSPVVGTHTGPGTVGIAFMAGI